MANGVRCAKITATTMTLGITSLTTRLASLSLGRGWTGKTAAHYPVTVGAGESRPLRANCGQLGGRAAVDCRLGRNCVLSQLSQAREDAMRSLNISFSVALAIAGAFPIQALARPVTGADLSGKTICWNDGDKQSYLPAASSQVRDGGKEPGG